jgi:hypothetical protein
MNNTMRILLSFAVLASICFACNDNTGKDHHSSGDSLPTTDSSSARPVATAAALKYDKFLPMRLIQQPDPLTCWAAVMTMLYSQHTNDNNIKIEEVLIKYGQFYVTSFQNGRTISAAQALALYKSAGLAFIQQVSLTMDAWYAIISKGNPLGVVVQDKPGANLYHIIIINGMKGDGSPAGTNVDFYDPLDVTQSNMPFEQFIKLYDGAQNWPLQAIHYP